MKDVGKIRAFKPTQNIEDTIRVNNPRTIQHKNYWNKEGNLSAILNQQCIKNNEILYQNGLCFFSKHFGEIIHVSCTVRFFTPSPATERPDKLSPMTYQFVQHLPQTNVQKAIPCDDILTDIMV